MTTARPIGCLAPALAVAVLAIAGRVLWGLAVHHPYTAIGVAIALSLIAAVLAARK